MTRWIDPQPAALGALSSLGLPPLVERILLARGIGDVEAARRFLHPDAAATTPFPGVQPLVERVQRAIRDQESICVWGDFDVDGQTSTAVLVQALQLLGARVSFHVPIRSTEGHGVHVPTLQRILDAGAQLVITCDTGITAHEAVAYARDRGVDVLITDHHDLGESLPDAHAIIDPKMLPPGHPLADLAGVGVAYKLAEALLQSQELDPGPLLDLVAMGLVADLALLRAETRLLTQRGILGLRKTERLGLRLLAEQAGAQLDGLTEETIGFALAPRLNALGRLGDANAAVDLLLSQDKVRGRVLALQIEGLNTQRKLLTAQVHHAAEEQLVSDPALLRQPVLLLEHPSWPGGVLGIVASRLVERYRKPALLLSRGADDVWRGSARSIEGLHITQAIAAHREKLLGFGGHPMAAGLSIHDENLPDFRRGLQRTAGKMLSEAHIEDETLQIDDWISLSQHSFDLARQLEQLAPFGPGNPAPVLATRGLSLASATPLGRDREHMKLRVVDESGIEADVLWWNASQEQIPAGSFDLAYTLRLGSFRGAQQLTLTLLDLRLHEQPSVAVAEDRLRVVDLRLDAKPSPPAGCLIWAEGTNVAGGVNRLQLRQSEQLAIWTAPPGRSELCAAMALVGPRTVYLVAGASDALDAEQAFLRHLAGMTKFAIQRREGHATISEMAAACGHRELTVRLGLEWLAASGHIGMKVDGDAVTLAATGEPTNEEVRGELLRGLKSLLEETAAYRTRFRSAPADTLLRPLAARDGPGRARRSR
jgi:single-stranded-DNA-specific exonuclease